MSSDLTAMRWQLIRTIEADQLLEQENIELRQKLKSCEEQLGQVTVAHREACAKIAIGMERTVSQLRSDIGDTRSQYFVEMDLMKQGFKEVAGQLGQMSRKNKELRQQSEALAVANARLQNDLEKSCSHSDKKTGHLSGE
jgi:regulator of replication initiation timing